MLSLPTHGTTLAGALTAIGQNLQQSTGGYVCLANVHMCMEAYDDPAFARILTQAQLVLADGRPIYWAQRLSGCQQARQIRGYDLVLALCEKAAAEGLKVGLYGGSNQQLLLQLEQGLNRRFPALQIVYSYAPPYFAAELPVDELAIQLMQQQQVQILLVGLGCPKQERWMALHQAHWPVGVATPLMFGVGAAFDYLAGSKSHAPKLLQRLGLEWLYRLSLEPKRLTGRYLKHNPRFILHFGWQWIRSKIKP